LGNILKFERGADFHYSKANKALDTGRFTDSLMDLRRSVEKEPENIEYRYALAELLSEMDLYEESNFHLYMIDRYQNDLEEDLIFSFGYNFYGLGELERSKLYFEKYMKKYPNGAYSRDVSDIYAYLCDELKTEADTGALEAYARTDEAKFCMDNGDYDEAIAILESLVFDPYESTYARNNLALAHFCKGDKKLAMDMIDQLLADTPGNVHATCNKVLLSEYKGNGDVPNEVLASVDALIPKNLDDQLKIAITFCEIGEHARAFKAYKSALEERPYDSELMFMAAAAAVNCGKISEARALLIDMQKVDAYDTIAQYYNKYIDKCIAKGEDCFIEYNYQVPPMEIQKRFNMLNSILSGDQLEAERRWKEDMQFRALLLWAFTLRAEELSTAVFGIIARFGDAFAEEVMRKYLLGCDNSDNVKRRVLGMLDIIGAEQPYMVYLDGEIVRATLSRDRSRYNNGNMAVLNAIGILAEKLGSPMIRSSAESLLDNYIELFHQPPIMRNVNAWAAAIVFIAARGTVEQQVIAEIAEVPWSAVERCIRKIVEVYKDHE